ncbi:MAG: HGGxSTG domain-containing protein, partial [bacterium]
MDDTACAAADAAAPDVDDPLADTDPNPAYLAALAGALELAEEARVFDLARALANPARSDLVSALLCHELASCHRLMMRFGAMADHYLSHTSPTVDAEHRQVGRDAIGFAAIAARLMARYRQGALALPKLRTDVDAVQKRIIVDWGFDDRPLNGGGDQGPAAGGSTGGSPSSPPAGTPAPSASAAPLRRGRLKNGNPSGDYLAAPRCGAKTRAGYACRQPAMKNGRCRLHGGKSTGARTAEGQHRAQTARLVHGRRTAAVIGLRSAAAAVNRRLVWMTELAREISAGHGVDRSDSPPPLD